mgnify:CR=1 FL=1
MQGMPLNNNMRCFEMLYAECKDFEDKRLNNNMRCFEMTLC